MGEQDVRMAEERSFPNMELAQLQSRYARFQSPADLQQLLDACKNDVAPHFYRTLCAQAGVVKDAALERQLDDELGKLLAAADAKIADAVENLGDVEVKNALLAKAELLNKAGAFTEAAEAYEKALEKTVGVGGRLDNLLAQIRMLLFQDLNCDPLIQRAYEELKKGADWERKNKLKVCEGMFRATQKADFRAAAGLLLDSVATFTSSELMSFEDFVFYAVLYSLLGLTRSELKKRVIGSPEILSVIHERPHMREFLFAFHDCDYYTWTREMVGVIGHINRDRYLHPQQTRMTKILRLNAFQQFLKSFKSVTAASMAQTFGVSREWIDQEVYNFISSGRLACKIDHVAGVIQTHSDEQLKSQQYKEILTEGDALLNKFQKFQAAIDR